MTFTPVQLATIRMIAEKYGVQEMTSEEQKGTFLDAKTRIIINCKVTSKEKEFKGLPEIGITDMKGFTDENVGGQTVDNIRDDIRSALKALPREKSKPKVEHDSATQGQNYTAPKEAAKDEIKTPEKQGIKPFDANTHKEFMDDVKKIATNISMIPKEVKHNESKAEKAQATSPPAPKPPEPEQAKPGIVKTCYIKSCGIELTGKRKLECYQRNTENPVFICEECEEAIKTLPEPVDIKENTMNESTQKPEKSEMQSIGNILEYIRSYVNNDVLEIFGDSGTGKSKFAVEVARQTIAAGKTVFYLDTERNLSKEEVENLKGCQYKYTPLISEISSLTRTLPKVDLVIIDSIGFPILTAYARMSMKQKGDALLNMIAIFGDLKEWAYRNNSIAIVINQPESDFNKEPGHLIRPFGDKSQFAAKEIWKTDVTQRGSVTKSTVQAFRSRSVGHKTLIVSMEVSNNGTIIKGARL